jgi:Protein of unknown function (DUF3710)
VALRRGKKDKAASGADDGELSVDGVDQPDGLAVEPTTGAPSRRPLDEAEAGGDDVLPRIDLGGLRVPVLQGTEVRVELNELQQPIAATIVHEASTLQILAFAAPRNGGIWDEVRGEIADSLRGDGGHAEHVDSDFGTELRVRVTIEAPAGQPAQTEQSLRFVGFDGPRWFVRGVFTGPAAVDAATAQILEAVLTSTVVIRGDEPMAPRDPLPLRLPRTAPSPADAAAAAEEPVRPKLELPKRGPEITETR